MIKAAELFRKSEGSKCQVSQETYNYLISVLSDAADMGYFECYIGLNRFEDSEVKRIKQLLDKNGYKVIETKHSEIGYCLNVVWKHKKRESKTLKWWDKL